MEKAADIRAKIYEIEDRIRTAPADTPNKIVFDWYREIDLLKEQLAQLPENERRGPYDDE